MRSILVLVFVLGIALNSCSDMEVSPPIPPPLGTWSGLLLVRLDYGESTETTHSAYATCAFGEDVYHIAIDWTDFSDHCLCNYGGRFSLGDGVVFEQRASIPSPVYDCQACREIYNPQGRFRREFQADTLVLTQLDGSKYTEFRLVQAARPKSGADAVSSF